MAELLERQRLAVDMAAAHVPLAAAAVAGLSAHMDPSDTPGRLNADRQLVARRASGP